MKCLLNFWFLIAFCFFGCNPFEPDLSRYMSLEEKAYRDRADVLPEKLLQDILSPAGPPESVDTPEKARVFNEEICEQLQSRPRQLLAKLKKEKPPPLFAEYHRLQISVWENVIVFTPRIVRALRRANQELFDAAYRNESQDEFNLEKQRILKEMEKEVDATEHLVEISVTTHNTAFEKINSDIKSILYARAKIKPPSPKLTLPSLDLNLGFQPYLIPVKISINQRGEVAFATQELLPTPICVFSIEQKVKFTKPRVLTIYYKNKKYLYSMDNHPFTFDVSSFQGSVGISFTEAGDLTLSLKSS